MPTGIAVRCLHCHSDQVVKHGTTARGPQRSVCQKTRCVTGSVLLDARHRGCRPKGKKLGIALRRNARGMRDTARSRRLSPDTVLRELTKQETSLESVHTALLRTRNPAEVPGAMERAGEAERDAMWSCVGNTPPALALACHGPSEGKGGGVRLRASQSRGLHHAPRAAGARWPDARFHRSLGRLHASPRR